MREGAIWSLLIATGLAVGVAVAGLNPHPKADIWQVAEGASLVAVLTVFTLALARVFLENVGWGKADG